MASAASNIAAATRELWLRTVVDEVFLRLPLVAMMIEHRQVAFRGGTKITQTVTKDDLESEAQSYATNEGLTAGSKTILDKPAFGWKKFQVPIRYTVDEELENQDADKATAPVDVVQALVKGAQTGARKKLNSMLYATTSGASSEDGKDFQGLTAALDHDATYGTLTRATTATNKGWQGASVADSYTDHDAAMTPSIAAFRSVMSVVKRHRPGNEKWYAFMGESLFQQYQSQVETRHIYSRDGSKLAKYGFETLILDGVELVQDSWLSENSRTTDIYWINPETWELRISPKRNFKMTGFVWQGETANGLDEYLARILVAGNFVCWQPNANCWRSNVA